MATRIIKDILYKLRNRKLIICHKKNMYIVCKIVIIIQQGENIYSRKEKKILQDFPYLLSRDPS